jgi:hypothetical protein
LYSLLLILVLVAACQPEVQAIMPPTAIPFPTMTPGQVVRGPLATAAPLDNSIISNPATAVALANRPTATPNYADCPPSASASLPPVPLTGRDMVDAIDMYLTSGGDPAALEAVLRDDWAALSSGAVRTDFDLTGEGTADIVVSLQTPDEGGMLVVFTCSDGRYTLRYQATYEGSAPQLVQVGDMNYDNLPELMFSSQRCEAADACSTTTQLITWRNDLGRFVSLLNGEIVSADAPTVEDMDADEVGEIVVRFTNPGSATTGPLRTGITIYDWNGASYVQSISQLDPPRFRIQVIHEADRALNRLNAQEAVPLYQLSLQSTSLEPWLNDEGPILQSYALYRLMLASAYVADGNTVDAFQQIIELYPDGENAPVYVPLAMTFWNAYQVTNNLRSACQEVKEFISARPEAVDLLNRYGSRSPIYTDTTLCPF